MKFLNENGEVVEGIPLTDEQLAFREKIRAFVHEKVCGGSYHTTWDRKNNSPNCDLVANFLVTKFKITPLEGVDFNKEIADAVEANAPRYIETPCTIIEKAEEGF